MQRGNWTRILRKLFVAGSPGKRRGKSAARRSTPARRDTVRPQLEGLEDRTLLSAQVFTVNIAGDNGGTAGQEFSPSTPFEGNLRWCINQADLPQYAGSTIKFDPSVFPSTGFHTINLVNGELPIADNMTIDGSVPDGTNETITISGDASGMPGPGTPASRVFDIIPSTATVTISNLTISGGNAQPFYTSVAGNQGGDIFNGGNLTLTNDIVQDGFSQGIVGGPPGRGGGIFNAEGQNGGPGATLTLIGTTITGNEAEGHSGLGAGGGIYNDFNATVNVDNGSPILNNRALGDAQNGPGAGGGVYNRGTLNLNGTIATHIVLTDNVAQGGTQAPGLNGGDAFGGGIFNDGTLVENYVDYLGDQAIGGAGGAGAPSGNGGIGGNAQGGAIYNAGSSALFVQNVVFGTDITGLGDEAVAGVGGKGGDGAGVGAPGGDGGNGGFAEGGAVASTSGGLVFKSVQFLSSLAIGGTGGKGGTGQAGLTPSSGPGGPGGHGGAGGDAGDALGGAVFNSGAGLNFSATILTGDQAQAGIGGDGGAGGAGGDGVGSTAGVGYPGGPGGFGGAGGVGAGAHGGGFYNSNGTLTIGSSSFTGSNAIGGNGGQGGVGGNGGQGADVGSSNIGGLGGPGGFGGKGGDTRRASGGAGEDQNGDATIGATFTSSVVQVGNGGAGGNGGQGGDSGNNTSPAFPLNGRYGGAGGNGGNGGIAGPGLGGALSVSSSVLNLTSSTFADNLINGGNGGAGGVGGTIGTFGHITSPLLGGFIPDVYVVNYPINLLTGLPDPKLEGTVNPAGNGGAGGAGSTVSGGAVSVTSAQVSGVDVLSRYQALNFGQSAGGQGFGFQPANPQGAAGPDSYIEAVNQALAIYNPKGTGTLSTSDSFKDFWFNQGGLQQADVFSKLGDPAVVWDEQIQRFIIVDQDVDGYFDNNFITQNKSFLDIAVSTSANPTSLTKADWNFFQIATSENQSGAAYDPQYPANIGWNHDALVVTLNMLDQTGTPNHVQVNAISIAALTAAKPVPLSEGTDAFQYDYTQNAGINLRPTVMHDSVAGDPMWFVQAGKDNASLNVVELTGLLSTTPTFTTTNLKLTSAYSPAVPLVQPNGTQIAPGISSDIEKVAEQNNELVAAQTVSDSAGDSDIVQWYAINVSGGTPVIQQVGDVGGSPGVYDAFPSIDINPNGDIGMTYMQTGTGKGQFMSMYVTGRSATDAVDSMRASTLVQGGLQNYNSDQVGPVSSISVDSDGSFWAANEYADLEAGFNWSTEVAHFSIPSLTAPAQTVTISSTKFSNTSITSGTGGAGGSGGFGGDNGRNHGINGLGGNGGLAQGGTVYLSSTTAQNAVLSNVAILQSTAIAGAGGAGAINVGTPVPSMYFKPFYGANFSLYGWNGFGSAGGVGGSVHGVGLAALDYGLNATDTSLLEGSGTAGNGGAGGGADITVPHSWAGGAGGAGGSVQGGAVYLLNNLNSAAPPLQFSFNSGSASNYTLTAGAGGDGGNAGASTTVNDKSNVAGGVGGVGGNAQGGGLYVFAGSSGVLSVALSNLDVLDDKITAGTGGTGGAGFLANGGVGGNAQGGGVFMTSLNGASGQNSSLNITASTLAGDDASGGDGGNAGSATTPNGGKGGNGGSAGNADGGGLFNGDNTPLTVVNSTFGGGIPSTTDINANPFANANVLVSGLGGRGGNSGTPNNIPANNGGPGGNGGSVFGGNVYNASPGASFMNDTLVMGQATVFGLGGVGGSGSGTGGQTGAPGTVGTGVAGGYYAALGSDNTFGNTILASNKAESGFAQDAAGSFTSLGSNVLTNTTGATGFNTGSGGNDLLVTTAQLNIGPLLNNGGPDLGATGNTSPTLTDALLANSSASTAGNLNLIPSGVTTDQRGPGFSRTFNNTVSSGAFEFLPPVIASLSPTSVIEGSSDLTLTVTGSNFSAGATVSFGTKVLTPIASLSNSSQLVVLVPAALLATPASVPVVVNVPDGSGLTGGDLHSAAMTFTVGEIPFTLNNPGSQQNYIGESVSLQVTPASGFTAGTFTDVVGSQHTLPPGLTIAPTTGIISGTVAGTASTTTPYSVTITATDSSGDQAGNTNSVTFTWTIGPPLVLNNPGPQSTNEGVGVNLLITAPPGYHPSGFIAQGLPPGLSINSTGLISGKIDPRGAGTYTVTVTPANNGGNGGITFTWTVNDTTPPTLTNPGTQTSAAGATVNLTIQAQDADPLTWTATGLPEGLSINAVGTIVGTIASSAQGNYAVAVTAMDGGVPSQPLYFTWNVAGSVLPPPPPPSPPGVIPPGTTGAATLVSIASVTNQYPGFVQLETVTVDVVNPNGYAVNEGVVAIQVDGQTAYAQVHDGVATATFATGLFDLGLWSDLVFSHPLTAGYSDGAHTFASSSAGMSVSAIWFDFFLTLLALEGGAI